MKEMRISVIIPEKDKAAFLAKVRARGTTITNVVLKAINKYTYGAKKCQVSHK